MAKSPSNTKKKRAPNKKPEASKAAKANPRTDQTNWKRKLQRSRVKFDDDQKEIFLDHFRNNNLKYKASEAAGVTMNTVDNHLKNDPDFAEAYDHAIAQFRDKLVSHTDNLIFNGVKNERFNAAGDCIEIKRDFPIRLIELQLKRVDASFRDKQDVDVNHKGGVMMAPAGVTPAEWAANAEQANADKDEPSTETETD